MGFRMARAVGGAIVLGKMGMHRRGAKRFFRFALAYSNRGNAFDELDASIRETALADARTVIAELPAGTGEELTLAELGAIRCPVGLRE